MNSKHFFHPTTNTLVVENHDPLSRVAVSSDPIYLICQFHIPDSPERSEEIRFCLKRNIEVGKFTQIILLNEREYSPSELGLSDSQMDNVVQIDCGQRLTFRLIFSQIHALNLHGYIAFANNDIFFDESIENVRFSCLSKSRSIYALLRFEFQEGLALDECKLFAFGNQIPFRYDSQDSWIIHSSSFDPTPEFIRSTDFELGVPCCDNRLAYLLIRHGYKCYNVPNNVKTYHHHASNFRRKYIPIRQIPRPHVYIQPTFDTRIHSPH